MSVLASPLVGVESLPGHHDQAWALSRLLMAQWDGGVSITTRWQTDAPFARSVAEHRRGFVGRPSRTVECPYLTFDEAESLDVESLMDRAAVSRWLAPLYPDASRVTANVSAGATVVPCDTTLRRFFAGGRVAVYRPSGRNATVSAYEVGRIASVATGSLTLTAPLVQAFAAGSRVVPLVESDVVLSSQATGLSARHQTATLEAVEHVGPTALPALQTPGTIPAGEQNYAGLPIFLHGLFARGSSPTLGVQREGSYSAVGIGSTLEAYGSRGRGRQTLPLTFTTRQAAWAFLKFADSRAGRLHPFWLPSTVAEFKVEDDIILNDVRVRATGPLIDWKLRPFVAVVTRSRQVVIVPTTGVYRTGNVDVVPIEPPLGVGIDPADVMRVCVARKVRFASDDITEEWATPRHMRCNLDVVEVLEEKTVVVVENPGGPVDETPVNCADGCVDELTPEVLAGLPATVTGGVPASGDIPGYASAVAAPGGTAAWDGSFVKISNPPTNKVYALPAATLAVHGKLVDYERSGVFWVPPDQRSGGVCWKPFLYLVAQQDIPDPGPLPVGAGVLGVNLANVGPSGANRDFWTGDVAKIAKLRPEGFYRAFRDADGHYPKVGTSGNRGWTVVNSGGGTVTLDFANGIRIDLTGGANLSNAQILAPGYGPGEPRAGQQFHQTMLDSLAPFKGALRMMDLQRINGSGVVNWADRLTAWDLPIELMIDLCNALPADLYVCIPHKASNDFIDNFVTMIRTRLNVARKVYVEYSNEIWNSGFSQRAYIRDTYGGGKTEEGWAQRHVATTNRFLSQWTGGGGASNRVVRVVAAQAANDFWAKKVAARVLSLGGGFEALSCSFYVGNTGQVWPSNITPEAIIDNLTANITRYEYFWKRHAALAKSYNKPLIGYEGHQHVTTTKHPAWEPTWLACQRHPKWYDFTAELVDRAVASGFSLLCHFMTTTEPLAFGAWGARIYGDEFTLAEAPKAKAYEDIAAGP